MTATRYSIEVRPTIPERLKRLAEPASDLLYTWDRAVRRLFFRLDADLWDAVGHNPKLFLRRIAQQRLDEAAEDGVFLEDYNRVLSVYDTYYKEKRKTGTEKYLNPKTDLVAYFCAEFGFHESLPIYSGGLGILAGDHCKAASDLGIPFVAVGLLYRQGYFNQTIDRQGNQLAHYHPTNFEELPIEPARDTGDNELRVTVALPGRNLSVKVWRARSGNINLYLLDTDLPENSDTDRRITYQLYGGDITTRIQQEIVLGIGGVRALRGLGLKPSAWHINEGHSAFMIVERCRERVKQGMDFHTALELVANGTVFTTHTPVAAGHDIFSEELMKNYFSGFVAEMGISMADFLKLGITPANHGSFNQTALALRGSRFHNGVSLIHGRVASRMEGYIWPQIPHEENPIRHVTNGVHIATFLAREWIILFDMRFGGDWRNQLTTPEFWHALDDVPDHSYWSIRQSLKSQLIEEVYLRITRQYRRNEYSQAHIERLTQHLIPQETDILTIGFARRFATYKRANLLFMNLERLARLVNDPDRPVIFVFAGKAHPHDLPGQQMIQFIHEVSQRPEFEGKILLCEGYDMALARRLVSGVDVWLNTPEYPLEASGTSGEKAGLNGVINLSVLDGWWGEGYNGENGWAITPHGPSYDSHSRNRAESNELLDIIEEQIVPLYYERNGHGYSEGWVKKSKASMKSILPRYNSQRMVMDYVREYYSAASRQCEKLKKNDGAAARDVARWKEKIMLAWPSIRIRRVDQPRLYIVSTDTLPVEVAAQLNGLDATDVIIECLVGSESEQGEFIAHSCHKLTSRGTNETGETLFGIDLAPTLPGLQYYKLRAYPHHQLLAHEFELGCMLWI